MKLITKKKKIYLHYNFENVKYLHDNIIEKEKMLKTKFTLNIDKRLPFIHNDVNINYQKTVLSNKQ